MKSKTISIEVMPEHRYEFIDLTDELLRAAKDSGVTEGVAVIYCRHTTTARQLLRLPSGAIPSAASCRAPGRSGTAEAETSAETPPEPSISLR